MSDVMLYLFSMANALKIDVAESVQRKLIKNAVKYPIPTR
jgi:NTP pyrophosphatase (non-canonical NTP hydrolase)